MRPNRAVDGLTAQRILEALAERGLLLEQDKRLPNVVTLVTGQALRTSWWSHPRARLIFATLTELARHPDVLFTKLLYGKVTLLHRRLWPFFLAVTSAREAWQVRGLSASALSLLQDLERTGSARASGPAVKELERRLLVHTEEVHTESGRHQMLLQPWLTWSRRAGCKPLPSLTQAIAPSRLRSSASARRSPHSPGRNVRTPPANRRRFLIAPVSRIPDSGLDAVEPGEFAKAKAEGTLVPGPHSALFAHDRERTIRSGAAAFTISILELLGRPAGAP